VPQVVQKRAPAGNGAPHPVQNLPAAGGGRGWATGAGGSPADVAPGGDVCGGAAVGGGAADRVSAAVGGTAAGGKPAGAGGRAGTAICAPVVPIAAGEIVSDEVSVRPHFGQAIQPGCSDARQSGHRPWPNGSVTPQNGHATSAPSMYFPQYGQGCLNVGIRTLLPAAARRPQQ
jgi:hypothetical protein